MLFWLQNLIFLNYEGVCYFKIFCCLTYAFCLLFARIRTHHNWWLDPFILNHHKCQYHSHDGDSYSSSSFSVFYSITIVLSITSPRVKRVYCLWERKLYDIALYASVLSVIRGLSASKKSKSSRMQQPLRSVACACGGTILLVSFANVRYVLNHASILSIVVLRLCHVQSIYKQTSLQSSTSILQGDEWTLW